MKNCRVLVVEDDDNLGYLLQENLAAEGFLTERHANGITALKAFSDGDFELCLIDVMLPGKDGITLAQEIRHKDELVPIVFLTAKALDEDRIRGLKVGADDYVTKPFSMEELLLRLHALLKRTMYQSQEKNEYRIGQYTFNVTHRSLRTKGQESRLTARECALLELLCLNRNNLLRREEALSTIWGNNSFYNGRSMDVYVAKLRKYLKSDPAVEIVTVHGKGIKLLA